MKTPSPNPLPERDANGRLARREIIQVASRSSLVQEEGWVPVSIQKRVDLEQVQQELAAADEPRQWRNLDEIADPEGYARRTSAEFPAYDPEADGVNRRNFMKMAGTGVALAGLTACTKQPIEGIVPYVRPPEEVVPGEALYFATSMNLAGYAYGLLAESHLGRPTKVEGSPEHPSSLGATTAVAQASVLDLYDPDRAESIRIRGARHEGGQRFTWDRAATDLTNLLTQQEKGEGEKMRLLTGAVTSPSEAAAIHTFLERFPKAAWTVYEPAGRQGVYEGTRAAFGKELEPIYDFSRADVILALDADFLGTGPGQVRYARDFSARREADGEHPHLNRLYVVEPTPTLTGAAADHRQPAGFRDVRAWAQALAEGVGVSDTSSPAHVDTAWLQAVVDDLQRHAGKSLVLVGDHQPPEVQALAHCINQKLGNVGHTVTYTDPVEERGPTGHKPFSELAAEIRDGQISLLVMAGGNPVYDAPVDLEFEALIRKVANRFYLGSMYNETALRCQWFVPLAHYLESWGDARSYDGTVSTTQPLIAPLYGGCTPLELFHVLATGEVKPPMDLLKTFWKDKLSGDPAKAWKKILHDGLVPRSGRPVQSVATATAPKPATSHPEDSEDAVELIFRPDPSVLDGRLANNSWLQELPKPLTRVTWQNVILISPALAKNNRLQNGDVIEIQHGERQVEGPVWIMPGQAKNTVTLFLGYGRRAAGRFGTHIGYNAYAIRTTTSPWAVSGARLRVTGRRDELATTQDSHVIENNTQGRTAARRNLVRSATVDHFHHHPGFAQHPPQEHPAKPEETLYPSPVDYSKGEQWGMTINLGTCIGCNACISACQAENNIPVVGKDQVARGRELQWIRVDGYFQGDLENPTFHHQPVNCMHCELAPCEPVCPVGATVHSQDGLNQMVYNRCVGTRYCANNCPYKVRRFNFHLYTDEKTEQLKLQRNPDVTVRVRGVMEKCTYCVQRINAARIEAKKDDRPIADGEVLTACQQVCPTRAIRFGNLNDPSSDIARLKASPLNYAILSDINTRARTTYLAKVTNPNPALAGDDAGHAPPQEAH